MFHVFCGGAASDLLPPPPLLNQAVMRITFLPVYMSRSADGARSPVHTCPVTSPRGNCCISGTEEAFVSQHGGWWWGGAPLARHQAEKAVRCVLFQERQEIGGAFR